MNPNFPKLINVFVHQITHSLMENAVVTLLSYFLIWEDQLDVEHVLKFQEEIHTIIPLGVAIVFQQLHGII